MITTRLAITTDFPAILALVTKIAKQNPTYPRTLTDSREEDVKVWWESMQTQNPVTLVAENDGSLVGAVNILIPPRAMLSTRLESEGLDTANRAEIAGMCVDPDILNQGLGKSLFTAAQDYIHNTERQSVLMVRPTAPSAVHIYKSHGLHEVTSFTDHGDTIFILAE